jgi:hypothetical protein
MTDNVSHESVGRNNPVQEVASQSIHEQSGIEKNLAEFKGAIVTTLNITKWIGAITAAVVVSLLVIGGWQLFAAIGRLDEKVIRLNYQLDDLDKKVNRLDYQMDEVMRLIGKKVPRADK